MQRFSVIRASTESIVDSHPDPKVCELARVILALLDEVDRQFQEIGALQRKMSELENRQ